MSRWRNLVGGEWPEPAKAAWIDVRDPSDDRVVVGEVADVDLPGIAQVYAAAEDGARSWGRTTSVDRGRVLLRAAGILRERRDEIARTLTAEMGKTLREALAEVDKSADFFEYFGGLGRASQGDLLAHERPDVTAYTVHEPLGIVLALTPWNDPLLTPARKLAPALISGNAVILKPASYTPLVGLALARALHDAGLPAGALNTVTGAGARLGDALLADPRLRAVSFTGSNEVGARLRRALAEREVRLLAELGGKNAAVVLADADVERAVATIAGAAFAQAGQRCTATSRLIVHRAVHNRVVDALANAAEALTLGPGAADSTDVGPLVAPSQRDSVLGFVERAVATGAELVTGGGRPTDEERCHGCYVQPTVISGVEPELELWTEEVFGPVVGVAVVDSEAEALELLNGSRYGLAAGIYTRDIGAAQRFAAAADVGQVSINLPTSGWDVHMPFGGFKASGSGEKEQGLEGLDFYRRTKTVALAP